MVGGDDQNTQLKRGGGSYISETEDVFKKEDIFKKEDVFKKEEVLFISLILEARH